MNFSAQVKSLSKNTFESMRPYWGLLALLGLLLSALVWGLSIFAVESYGEYLHWLPLLLIITFITTGLAIASRTPANDNIDTLALLERNAGWLVFISYTFTALSMLYIHYEDPDNNLLLMIGIYLSVNSTLLAVTRPIDYNKFGPDKDGDEKSDPVEEDNYVVNAIFRIAYGFVFLCAIGIISLAFTNTPIVSDHHNVGWKPEELLTERVHQIIAVVRGCDYQFQPPVDQSSSTRTLRQEGRMPVEAECGDLPPQWVLTIGGNVLVCHILQNCAEAIDTVLRGDAAPIDLPALQQTLKELKAKKARLESDVEKYTYLLTGLEMEKNVYSPNTADNKNSVPPALAQRIDNVHDSLSCALVDLDDISLEIIQKEREISAAEQMLVSRKQVITDRVFLGQPITGGVVVPVYFLILAMIGALINMSRKLPEYQRRITPAYHFRYKADVKQNPQLAKPMTGAEVREFVTFQMIQVLTAAGVAIIAYSWAKPEELAAGVVLAFVAGFSSEVVLLAVRGVAERLISGGTRKIQLISEYEVQPKKTEVATQSVDAKPSAVFQVPEVSLAPLSKGQQVKLLNSKTLADGTVLELLSEGTIKSITDNDITVTFKVGEKSFDAIVNRSDLALSEQVGASIDDLKG